MDKRVQEMLDRALSGKAPTRQECVALLSCSPTSLETSITRAVADTVSRKRFSNGGTLAGQVGVEVSPCPANCGFCAFGAKFTQFTPQQLSDDDILQRVHGFVDRGDLNTLFLMTMHHFDFTRLLNVVRMARKAAPPATEIVVNIGDFDDGQARELKAAGAGGAYHVCRLREGIDTKLDPIRRRKTLGTVREAGLNLHYCCEPIGPEHTPQELVEQMFIGIDHGCHYHAAMRRVPVPGTPLAGRGQISELRLAQVVAVVALATLECEGMSGIGVHEPNILGLTSGATNICAETGANPRDTAEDTSKNRGRSVNDCRRLLLEAGFELVLGCDGTRIPLTLD
jgi:biotin synthase